MSNFVTKSSYSLVDSMVFSNCSLSFFDCPMDRENKNVVINLLQDISSPIIAVWLVSRPINYNCKNNNFQHWCVKIQAKGHLISIDFLQSNGKGAFRLQERSDIGIELKQFMYYSYDNKTKYKWNIISSITPHPLHNKKYFNYLSDHEQYKLKKYIQSQNKKNCSKDYKKFMKSIQCKRKVSDIAKFIRFWTQNDNNIVGRYNPITKNCQQFAAQLFAYLIAPYYMDEIERVFNCYQSPFDKRKWKKNKTEFKKESIKLSNKS